MERGWRQKLTPFSGGLSFGLCVVPNSNMYVYIFLKHEKDDVEAVNFKASLEVDLINV